MSYRLHSLGEASDVSVGRRAFSDPILARASLDAAKIMERMARVPRSDRRSEMARQAESMGRGLGRESMVKLDEMMSGGVSADKAIFNALRLTIANRRMDESLARVKDAIAASSRGGLGQFPSINLSPSDRVAACTAAGAGATVGGVVGTIPVYGQIVGGILQLGSQIAGQAIDCSREQREAAAATAAAQAREAEARAQAAAIQAQIEDRRRRSTRNKVLFAVGAVAAAGVVYWALS
jgi:hypothetical protein